MVLGVPWLLSLKDVLQGVVFASFDVVGLILARLGAQSHVQFLYRNRGIASSQCHDPRQPENGIQNEGISIFHAKNIALGENQ